MAATIQQSMIFSRVVDRAKGLAIILVILGHINSPLSSIVFSFHIPMFFFLAGIFIKSKYTNTEFLRKGINRLIIPYLIFSFVGYFVTMAKNEVLHRQQESIYDALIGIIFWMDAPHMHHYGFVLWFLPALFWGRLIVYMFVKYLKPNTIVMLLASIALAWMSTNYFVLPFGIDKGLVALPWIMMGYIFYQHFQRWFDSGWYGVISVIVLLTVVIYFYGIVALDLAIKETGNLFVSIPYTLFICLLLTGLLYLCQLQCTFLNKHTDPLTIIGRNSMLVLIAHVYTNNAIDIAMSKMINNSYWYLTFILSVISVYILIMIKQRFQNNLIFKYM